MPILSLLVVLIVALVIIWAVRTLMGAFGVGEPITTVVYVLIVVIFLLWFVSALGILPMGELRLR